MDIDLKAGTITFRVLYHGPRGATKFLNLRSLQSRASGGEELSVLHADGDRIVTLRLGDDEQPLLGLRVGFQAVAAPGAIGSRAVERLLVLASDAVVFLPDRGRPASRNSRRALSHLTDDLVAAGIEPGDFPFIIQDYADGNPRLERQHLDERTMAFQPKFLAVPGDTPQATETVFTSAREAVIERVRGLAKDLGDAGARQALLRRVSDREEAFSNVNGTRKERWSVAVLWAVIGAAAAAAAVSVLL